MDMRSVPTCSPAHMKDWEEICKAFAKKMGWELLFVNEQSCGLQDKNENFHHIYIEEMVEYLK